MTKKKTTKSRPRQQKESDMVSITRIAADAMVAGSAIGMIGGVLGSVAGNNNK
jgi:hypothetical protein